MVSHDNTKPPTRHNSIPLPLSFEESTTVLLSALMDSNKITTVVDPVTLASDAESHEKPAAAVASGNHSGGRKSDSGVYVDNTIRNSLKQQLSESRVDEEESPSSPIEDIYGGAEIDDTQDEPESPEDQGYPDLVDNQNLTLSMVELKVDSAQASSSPDTASPESPPIHVSPPVQPEFSLVANGGVNATHPGSFLRRQPSVHVTPPTSPNVEVFDASAPSISSLLEQEEAAVLASTKETGEEISIETSDPSHLFWVPASQHPEIAPAEFNSWLKKHGYNTSSSNRGGGPSRMKRRKSILSVSYKPEDIDAEVDQEAIVEKGVEGGTENDKKAPSLGILEEDYVDRVPIPPKRLGGYLRRSISLNVPQVRDLSEDTDVFNKNSSPDDQSPIIVPRDHGRPILRRSARTKIRRNSVDDGAPSEPGESRRWSSSVQGQHRRSQSHDVSDKPHMSTSPPKSKPTPLSEQFPAPPPREAIPLGGVTLRDDPVVTPTTDIGVTPADIEVSPNTASSVTDTSVSLQKKNTVIKPFVSRLREPDREVISLTPKKEPSPDQEQEEIKEDSPESVKHVVSTTPRSSSLITLTADSKGKAILSMSGPGAPTTVPVPTPSISNGLSRKSTWSWLFSSDDKEKLKKAKFELAGSSPDALANANKLASKDIVPPKSPKEPDTASVMSGDSSSKKFGLSSLFSRSSKTPINTKSMPEIALASTPTAAVASPEMQAAKKPKYSNYNRLPIHVERAIYRLSHIKLANPRRPLHHQVLISNLMFWYLSVVNQQGQNGGAASRQQQSRSPQDQATKKKNKNQQGGKKRRKSEGIQKKNKASNGQSRPRAAETAIRAPQYDVQQHIIAQQYRTNQAQQQMYQSQQQQAGSGPQIYPAQDSRYPFIQPAGPTSYTNLNSIAESIPVNPQMSLDEYDSAANDVDSNYDDDESEYDYPVVNNRLENDVPYSDDEKYDQTAYKPRFAGKAAVQDTYSSDGSDGSDEASTPQTSRPSLDLAGLDAGMTTFGDDLLSSFGLSSNGEVRLAGNKVASGGRTTVNAPAASAIGLGNANGSVSMNGHGNHRQPPALDIKNPRRSRSPNPPIVRGKSPAPSISAIESEADDDEDDVPLAVYARAH